jgi:hypothetical protein
MWMIEVLGYYVNGSFIVIILVPKNHLLSCHLSFIRVLVIGEHFFK